MTASIPHTRSAMARANGIDLCWDGFGDPRAVPLLLIMGLGTQKIAWDDDFCATLAAVRVPTPVIHGDADPPLTRWSRVVEAIVWHAAPSACGVEHGVAARLRAACMCTACGLRWACYLDPAT